MRSLLAPAVGLHKRIQFGPFAASGPGWCPAHARPSPHWQPALCVLRGAGRLQHPEGELSPRFAVNNQWLPVCLLCLRTSVQRPGRRAVPVALHMSRYVWSPMVGPPRAAPALAERRFFSNRAVGRDSGLKPRSAEAPTATAGFQRDAAMRSSRQPPSALFCRPSTRDRGRVAGPSAQEQEFYVVARVVDRANDGRVPTVEKPRT